MWNVAEVGIPYTKSFYKNKFLLFFKIEHAQLFQTNDNEDISYVPLSSMHTASQITNLVNKKTNLAFKLFTTILKNKILNQSQTKHFNFAHL